MALVCGRSRPDPSYSALPIRLPRVYHYKQVHHLSQVCQLTNQAFFLHRAYVLIGRKKWILVVIIPQLCV